MVKVWLTVLALVAILALPFVLRPSRVAPLAADDTLVIITPHNEAIRHEYTAGFTRWYRQRTGRTVALDWRVIGGTSEINRFVESEYVAAFRNQWTARGRPWSSEVLEAFANPRIAEDAPEVAREARRWFLRSEVSCGIDLFFGGGSYDLERHAQAGRLVPAEIFQTHPAWFEEAVIPRRFAGEVFWDEGHAWIGTVLSTYGIIYNRDSLARLGIVRPPAAWDDLADYRFVGELALADPTKSSSMAKAFENLIQQKIHRRLRAARESGLAGEAAEQRAVREGWLDGLRLIQRIAANARYFTDSSQKPPIDVAQGNCAAGICIDFYGRSQAEAVAKRGGQGRLGFVSPPGGTVSSVDPIGVLRGAPNRDVAGRFIEFLLSMEGQKLWNFQPGTPGGPERFALRRLPVRRDFYGHAEWSALRSDPEENPFTEEDRLVYHSAWTGGLIRELGFVVRVMCLDSYAELVAAWQAVHRAPPGVRERALAVMAGMSEVEYDRVAREIKRTLEARDQVDVVRLAGSIGEAFRVQYREAVRIAEAGGG